jgi:hypothetical protein
MNMDLISQASQEVGELSPDVIEKLESDLVFTECSAPSKPLTLVERAVCELRADKKSNMYIASYLGISLVDVKRILARNTVKEFLQTLINAQYDLSKEYRLEIMGKIIDSKIREIEEDMAGDYKGATKKDLVDLIMLQDSLLKEREKKELGTNEDTYITLLQQITK